MSAQKSFYFIFLLSTIALSVYIDIDGTNSQRNLNKFISEGQAKEINFGKHRFLQVTTVNDKIAAEALTKIINDINTQRKELNTTILTRNQKNEQLIYQWASKFKSSMNLIQYLQIYGLFNAHIQVYQQIPVQFIVQVIERLNGTFYDRQYEEIATYYNAVSNNNYQIIFVSIGGNSVENVIFSKSTIENAVTNLLSQLYQKQRGLQSSPVENATVNYTQSRQASTLTNQSAISPNNNQSINLTHTINSINQTLLNTKGENNNIEKGNSTNIITQINATQGRFNDSQAPSNATQSVLNTSQIATKLASINKLPLVSQLVSSNNTSFPSITLFHNVPTTFLLNQLFPFKGSITISNPSGLQVNVIFTRISDLKRLAFNQYLTANSKQFEIIAYLNLSGDYYLSVFIGGSGTSAIKIFTIAPFNGSIISRSPTPVTLASLNLINNDLWLNWTYSDVVQPPITQVFFTQSTGQSVQFLLSNYENSYKIPYNQFYQFNLGTTNIQISQAFSSTESAFSRTSQFSTPYNMVFNATHHNFGIIQSSNMFNAIPNKIKQGSNLTIAGAAGKKLDNQVILLTPNRTLQSYYLLANKSVLHVPQNTFIQNLAIPLLDTGVYILQVNDANGSALINIPLYVGDIYPLLPDFRDLSPTSIDLVALNQPTSLSDRRNMVLKMINKIRTIYGVGNIYLDQNLNNLAQNYSNISAQNNYVAHVDLQGNTPNERAIAAGITEGVAENLATNTNLTNAQLMLQRSPAHLRSIINPAWTRVGLGIVQNSNQYYYLTQQFSSRDFTLYPMTKTQINTIQSTIINYILSQYGYIKAQNKGLSQALLVYQNMASQPSIVTYLKGLKYNFFSVVNVVVSYNNGKFMDLIKSGLHLQPSSTAFTSVGATVIYLKGNLQIFTAFT